MNCQTIEESLNKLTVNSRGSIRGKNKCVDEIHRAHLKTVDNSLIDVRIFVARLSTGHTTKEALQLIDEYIYKKQRG